MATGGGSLTSRNFRLPLSDIGVTIVEGSIVETSAEAVATGEDHSLEGRGGVSQLLLKACPSTYKRAREQLKKNTSKFEFGKIYPCHFPIPSGKKGVSFNVILHAIVPSAKVVTKQKDWMDQMKVLYYNLLKAANNQGKSSLALPVMGSGGAGASMDIAMDVLVHALTTFTLKQEVKAHSHHLKDVVLYVRRENAAFGKLVAKMEAKLKTLPRSNGIAQPAAVRSGKTPPLTSSKSSGHQGSANRTSNSAWMTKSEPEASFSRNQFPADMSNMELILNGMTLHSQNASARQEEEEEEMDCDEYEFVNRDEVEGGDKEEKKKDDEKCAICLDEMEDPKKLEKCGHTFCKECIEDSFRHHKPVCPSCNTVYGVIMGNQPRGSMRGYTRSESLPGYERYGQIIIDYEFPSGIQGREHPNPGQPFHGTSRRAFLPDCAEGRKVYRLLRVAFENRLIFTVGRSVTTGYDNVVTWNDIHHKTKPHGGATGFGYPDPHYLSRVQEELAAKGVTEESLAGRIFDL